MMGNDLPTREQVARIMDPQVWCTYPDGRFIFTKNYREVALQRADEMLNLFGPIVLDQQETIEHLRGELKEANGVIYDLMEKNNVG